MSTVMDDLNGRVVIRANRFHVLTHPRTRPLVEGRFGAMLDDFDFAAGGSRPLEGRA
jgi:hypothetical protein